MQTHHRGILIFGFILFLSLIFPAFNTKAINNLEAPSFDWRDHGYDFPVRDQMKCKAGNAFAGVEAVQAAIWKKEGVKVDLSENNAMKCNWDAINNFDIHSCGGGDFKMIINQFTQNGLVLESCDSLDLIDQTCNKNCESVYYVTEWQHISQHQKYATVETIKDLLLENGPIYTQMDANFIGFEGYKGDYVIYYLDEDITDNKHAVLIVGWDDNLIHSNGKGAWIAKNSYGTDWGNEGYFKVAYGSAGVGNNVSVVTGWEKSSPPRKLYYYDEAGHNHQIEPDGVLDKRGSTLGLFTIDEEEVIRSVAFWTTDAATVNAKVYTKFENGSPKDLVHESNVHNILHAGYYSINLRALELLPGEEIAIELEVTNKDNLFPIATDILGPLSDNRTWYKDENGSWSPFSNLSRDSGIRLQTWVKTENFTKVFLPLLTK